MRPMIGTAAIILSALGLVGSGPFPEDATFTTVSITPLAIEGLTGDDDGVFFE